MALDFDLCCTTRLLYYDMELEKRRLEAMSGGALANAVGGAMGGGGGITVDRSKAEYW